MDYSSDNFLIVMEKLDDHTKIYLYNRYKNIKNKNNKSKKDIIKKNIMMVAKESPKYQIILVFINKILENIGKNKINNLTDFIDIDRLDILKQVNIDTFIQMESEILKYYDKKNIGWYARNRTKHYILVFLRKVCIELGLIFKSIQKEKSIKGYKKTYFLYSIKKNI
jgi:hypothetical protein